MQSFAEFAAESFQSEVQLNWKLKSPTHAAATFTVQSALVEVSFERREPDGPWYTSFDTVKGDLTDKKIVTLAFQIFNGVLQAVREFTETREPELMIFASKEEALTGIYETYLRRERPAFHRLGYQVDGPQRNNLYTEFVVRPAYFPMLAR